MGRASYFHYILPQSSQTYIYWKYFANKCVINVKKYEIGEIDKKNQNWQYMQNWQNMLNCLNWLNWLNWLT